MEKSCSTWDDKNYLVLQRPVPLFATKSKWIKALVRLVRNFQMMGKILSYIFWFD